MWLTMAKDEPAMVAYLARQMRSALQTYASSQSKTEKRDSNLSYSIFCFAVKATKEFGRLHIVTPNEVTQRKFVTS